MAAFGKNNTREIHDSERWDPWEKVVIRSLTNREHHRILHHLEKGKRNKGADGIKLTDTVKLSEMVLQKCIVSWTFTVGGEPDGEVADINSDTFNDLPKNYSDFIEKEIQEFIPDTDDEFLGTS